MKILIILAVVFFVTGCEDDQQAVALMGGGPGSDANTQIVDAVTVTDGSGTKTNASIFGSVDNPATGGSGDPGTSGDWHTGAWGYNIGDPNAQGVSLPASVEAAAFGGNANNANGELVQVTNLDTGQTGVFAIVDKGPGAKSVANGYGIDMLPASASSIGVVSGSRVEYTILHVK